MQAKPNQDHTEELLLQVLELARRAGDVYRAALPCAADERLRQQWSDYLQQTAEHVCMLEELCEVMAIDPERQPTTRKVMGRLGRKLVQVITQAHANGTTTAAQIVASECVLLLETRYQFAWQALGRAAARLEGETTDGLREACAQVEAEEHEHLQHSRRWCRELWTSAFAVDPMHDRRDAAKPAMAPSTRAARARGA